MMSNEIRWVADGGPRPLVTFLTQTPPNFVFVHLQACRRPRGEVSYRTFVRTLILQDVRDVTYVSFEMLTTRTELLILLAGALCLPACGDDKGDTNAATESGTSDPSGTEASTDMPGTTEDGTTEDTDGETTEGPIDPMVPAGGIDIVAVEANQGTRVDIGLAGEWSDGNQRSTYLVKNRNTLIRVHFTVDSDWVPHEVEARLKLIYPDSTEKVLTNTLMVEASSTEPDIKSTFFFGLLAEDIVPNLSYQVELYEHMDAHTKDPTIWATPQNPALVGIEDAPVEMKIVLVPLHYTAEGKDVTAAPTEEALQALTNWMSDTNPVQNVTFELHEPLEWNEEIFWLDPVLQAVAQIRAQDAPAENVYYHALVDIDCQFAGCGNGGLLGQAIDLPSDSKNDAYVRVASSIYHDPGGIPTALTLETIVHEHGHSQGLQHVFCPGGGSGGNDPNYPHPEGQIEGWGFGISNSLLYPPDYVDYMSYCHPQFVGPWTWSKTFNRIKTLTSWDYEDSQPAPAQALLVASHFPDGTEAWWTTEGGFEAARQSGTHQLEIWRDGQVTTQPVEVRTLSEGPGYWVVTPMPSLAGVDKLVHVGPDLRYEVSPEAIADTLAAN